LADGTTQDDDGESDRVIAGRALRALRSRVGLRQRDVAERSGIWAHYISEIENGHRRVSWETVARLLRATGVAPRDFAVEVEAQERLAPDERNRQAQ
jgi:transcriptional regulator with XRE-family HTH domain